MEIKFCFKWNSHLRWLLAGIIAASNFYTETGIVDTKLWEKSISNTLKCNAHFVEQPVFKG